MNQSCRVLVEQVSEGAVCLDAEGLVLYANARFAELVGQPLEQVMGARVQDRIDDDALRVLLETAVASGEARGEVVIRTPLGTAIPAFLSVRRTDHGGQQLLYVVATDLREQRRIEGLITSEALARAVIEQAADAIVVCDETGRVIRASESATVLCGNNPLFHQFDEVFALRVAPPDGPPVRHGSIALAAASGTFGASVPAELTRQDGTNLHVLVSGNPLRDWSGRPFGCVITIVDISEAKQAEEILRRANLELTEIDQRKNDFLAILSHELRNPLAPIRNSIRVLERSAPGSDQARRALSVIDRQTEQLSRLVDDLLDVARVSQNKIRLKPSRIDLGELVHRAVEDQRSLFETAGITLVHTRGPASVFVDGDANRLAQVLGNLLHNAAKFTPRGGETHVTLTVDPGSGQVELSVRDTGAGVAPEVLPRLFQPFTQADTTLERSRGGLGLGLSLVKGIVELHKGTVTVESKGIGQGSEFIVRLPLATEDTVEAARPSASAPRPKCRVLVIEDNEDAANSLRDVLELDDHAVEVALSGPDGVARGKLFRPDVVLCDVGLPGMDGYGVARSFRSDDDLRGTYLVALSGYALPEDLERAEKAGFDRHLSKPPDFERLAQILAQVGAQRASASKP